MYSDQKDMKNKNKAPGQVNLIHSLQLFICLQWRQLVLLTVEHMLPLKLSCLYTFPPKPYAEPGIGISASPSHPHPPSFLPSRQAHKEQFPAWQSLCLILFGVALAFQVGHRCQEELGAALPAYPYPELLQHPGGGQGDGDRGWHEAGCPHGRCVPPRCTMASSHGSGWGCPSRFAHPASFQPPAPALVPEPWFLLLPLFAMGPEFPNHLQTSCSGWGGSRQPQSRGAAGKAEPPSARESRAGAALLWNHGEHPAALPASQHRSQPPTPLPASQQTPAVCGLVRSGVNSEAVRARRVPCVIPISPSPCGTPVFPARSDVCVLRASLARREMFSPEHPELPACFVYYLPLQDACLFDQPLSQAPMWILNEQVSECASETAGFRGRLQFQLTQTNFTVTFYQRQKSKIMKETWVSCTMLKVFFLNMWAHLLNVEIQICL